MPSPAGRDILAYGDIFPRLIANVAMGPDMRMPVWLYATIFALIFGCYFLVSLLLSRRLKQVSPAGVLKQRE